MWRVPDTLKEFAEAGDDTVVLQQRVKQVDTGFADLCRVMSEYVDSRQRPHRAYGRVCVNSQSGPFAPKSPAAAVSTHIQADHDGVEGPASVSSLDLRMPLRKIGG